mgnify:CR=1 FL=1|jgi:hypothetical protein
MSLLTYYLDISALGQAYINHNYEQLRQNILKGKVPLSFYLTNRNEVYGYHIHINSPLSKIYGFKVYMVDFVFSSISNLHLEEQEAIFLELFNYLKQEINATEGYYNFRLPTHIVDVLKSFNQIFEGYYVCGGLVTYISHQSNEILLKSEKKEKIKIVYPDQHYIAEYRNDLLDIAKESFSSYQGQYHISPTLSAKAPEIYSEWLTRAFSPADQTREDRIVVAHIENQPVGFWTYTENEYSYLTGLTAVAPKFRNFGIYKKLLIETLNSSMDKNKNLLIGTQFDNFIVQHVWGKMGLSPFVSYYNIHFNRLRDESDHIIPYG